MPLNQHVLSTYYVQAWGNTPPYSPPSPSSPHMNLTILEDEDRCL